MTEPTHDQIEPLLWMVHDECMSWLTDHRERTVPTNERIDRLIMAIADLAKALAGGYREGGFKGD
jgi:hypothetical protein